MRLKQPESTKESLFWAFLKSPKLVILAFWLHIQWFVLLLFLQRQESSTHADDFGNDKSSLVEDDRRRQEQQQMDVQIDIDQNLIREREERLQQIEGDILDINEIFRDLANMVYDQGTLVDSIEANVDVTHGNLEGANVNLSKASSYQKKARTKMCILLIILLVVAGIIALIVILTTNH
ncbi:PREDICTED: syntaxin-12-like [Acropora digitifera]|uniref:syntaxin-12-like n=1 Tax=Acropora digitifera TaxID=70779 RepID=UPI00077AD9C2|nr:PREDICTED: syntaxin-12-like [Acropora digitifera]